VEEAALAFGGAEEPNGCVADGEQGREREIDFVFDARGFVDDEQGDGGEAADMVLIGGDADDAGSVFEFEAEAASSGGGGGEGGEIAHFANEFADLLFGGGGDDDGGLWLEVRGVDGDERGGGGFAGLA